MFGSISVVSRRVKKPGCTSTICAPAVCRMKPARRRSCGRRSVAAAPAVTGRAGRSRSSAAPPRAVRFDALRTARSAHFALRPCDFARPRSEAAASLTTLRRRSLPMFGPLALIGVEEPMFVSGAIARTSAAWPIQTPADAARAPVRGDVDDHRDFERELLLDDLAHRLREAAGRVEHDHGRVVARPSARGRAGGSGSPAVTGLTSASKWIASTRGCRAAATAAAQRRAPRRARRRSARRAALSRRKDSICERVFDPAAREASGTVENGSAFDEARSASSLARPARSSRRRRTPRADVVAWLARDVPLGARALAARRRADALRTGRPALAGRRDGGQFRTRRLAGRWSAWRACRPRTRCRTRPGAPSEPRLARRQPLLDGPLERHPVPDGRPGRRLRAYFVWSPRQRLPDRARSTWRARRRSSRAPAGTPTRRSGARRRSTRSGPARDRPPHGRLERVHAGPVGRRSCAAIELYHVKGNGWNDIGYNFLVDKYGQVFEGRYGGMTRNVIGAHAQGFNTGSVGIALIGDFSSTAITPRGASRARHAARLAARRRSRRSALERRQRSRPATRVCGRESGHPARGLRAPRHLPHECPGRALYAQLPSIADAVAQTRAAEALLAGSDRDARRAGPLHGQALRPDCLGRDGQESEQGRRRERGRDRDRRRLDLGRQRGDLGVSTRGRSVLRRCARLRERSAPRPRRLPYSS